MQLYVDYPKHWIDIEAGKGLERGFNPCSLRLQNKEYLGQHL